MTILSRPQCVKITLLEYCEWLRSIPWLPRQSSLRRLAVTSFSTQHKWAFFFHKDGLRVISHSNYECSDEFRINNSQNGWRAWYIAGMSLVSVFYLNIFSLFVILKLLDLFQQRKRCPVISWRIVNNFKNQIFPMSKSRLYISLKAVSLCINPSSQFNC